MFSIPLILAAIEQGDLDVPELEDEEEDDDEDLLY